jgi:L-threonylcarbamoyladenylate synthase
MPEVLRVDPENPDEKVIARAAAMLMRGELVAFPTETVYGLGADALSPEAVAKIFEAKGRPAWNPVIAHVADPQAARALCTRWPSAAERLAEEFWPGPLTIVLPKRPIVPDIATAGHGAVAIRIPAHPVALALLRAVARPIAAPSANRFTRVSPTTAAHVVESLGDRVSLVIDGGPCDVGIESTVVDLASTTPTVLRPGAITREQLEAVLQEPIAEVAHRVRTDDASAAGQRAPGMADRHYSPVADVWLFDPSQREEVTSAVASLQATDASSVVVAMLLHCTVPVGPSGHVIRMPSDPRGYAREVYAALHAADAHGATIVLVERPPDTEPWRAIRDRLARAAR